MKRKDAAVKAARAGIEAARAAGLLGDDAAADLLAQVDTAAKGKGVKRPLPGSVEPAGKHREPDGTTTVEQLEPQAGLPTDPDKKADKVPASVAAMKEAPYVVKRMHDAWCAAYAVKDVIAEYPALEDVAAAAEPSWFTTEAAKAAGAGDAITAADLGALAKAAETIRALDPAAVSDGRAVLRKSFTDMYPTEHIKPGGTPKPASYQRPYLGAGHAAESAGDWTVRSQINHRDHARWRHGVICP